MHYKIIVMRLLILFTSILSTIALGSAQQQLEKITNHFKFSNGCTGVVIHKEIFENLEEINAEKKPQNPWFYGWELKVAF